MTGEIEVYPGEPGWDDCHDDHSCVVLCTRLLDEGIVGESEVLDWCDGSLETRFEVIL